MSEAYKVGKGRPPVEHRFQPGHEGRGGRPKGSGAKTALEKALAKKVVITVDGRRRRVTIGEAMNEKLIADALNGDKSARKLVMEQMAAIEKARASKPAVSAEPVRKGFPTFQMMTYDASMMCQLNVCVKDDLYSSFRLRSWIARTILDAMPREELLAIPRRHLGALLEDASILDEYFGPEEPTSG